MTILIPDTSLDGGGAGGTGAFPVEFFTGLNKNLVASDNLKFFVMDNVVAPQAVNIPDNATDPIPIGAEMVFLRNTTLGTVTFVIAGFSAVLQSRDGLVEINTQYSAATLKKIDTDEWRLFGDLV